MKFLAFTLIALCSLAACKKNEATIVYDSTASAPAPEPQAAPQPPAPAAPAAPTMTKHGDTVVSSTGLKYIDMKVGKGASPMRGQTITVNYTGKLTDGKTFDSNVDPAMGHVEPFSTPIGVGRVIPGWDEGMMSMKVGGKRRLIVPSDMGYGPQGNPPKIPGGATLIFDVELLGVQ